MKITFNKAKLGEIVFLAAFSYLSIALMQSGQPEAFACGFILSLFLIYGWEQVITSLFSKKP